ncbi:MAG: hypothetical protein FD130_1335 [Halothiobacillaceae bacterium]|nr:MAG: hypothetical protein FD130_1335 [Halothiobacillaceae bacterium]
MLLGSIGIGVITCIIAITAGRWLDRMAVLDQTALFVVFQTVSLGGIATALLWWFTWVQTPWQQLLVIIAALAAWRVSYFPIMVFAGWIATLVEQLLLPYKTLPIVIYPTYLLCMGVMNYIAAMAAGAIVTLEWTYLLPVTVPAFTIATMISFIAPIDFKLLPDTEVRFNEPLPSPALPQSNAYLAALTAGEYSLRSRLLLFAGGSVYKLIPHSPWSATVKGTLEELTRKQPRGSATLRVREHYFAYHCAHPLIGSRRHGT